MATKKSVRERSPLGRVAIAATATEMIRERGIEKLTMRAVAAQLGVSAMALYHHVEDKDELLRLVGDELLGQIDLPDPESGEWRDLFTYTVNASIDSLLSLPGLSSVVLTSKLLPNARRLLFFSIRQFERAGLDRDRAQEAYAGVQQLVLGHLLVHESANFQTAPTSHPDADMSAYLMQLRSRKSFDHALAGLLDHYPPS
ncbi:TetR/AcrR family transcriptional regulator [Gordonia insulae]|uniref:HTH tetR-type domain-containing protein n=1 Tax=Gordonia insulae TaxID=2420509 RepID=A0A3G8JLK7_9ACTN|nr:TetR/AcrR family transcriptional regulator [Gordonia insulae]AZG45475.1 hypothetical protein D7316_02071 [Gordonia insulae]